jgi:hypothetical protein
MLERWTTNPFEWGEANVIRGTLIRLLNVPVMAADWWPVHEGAHSKELDLEQLKPITMISSLFHVKCCTNGVHSSIIGSVAIFSSRKCG